MKEYSLMHEEKAVLKISKKIKVTNKNSINFYNQNSLRIYALQSKKYFHPHLF